MEEDHAVASSSLKETPGLDNREAGDLLVVNVSDYHKDGSSKDESCWADSDEEVDGASDLDREWQRRREQFYNTGYRDGVSAGTNDAAQDGFNHGFKDSVMVGYKWGIVRGITSALAHMPTELKMKLIESEEIRKDFMNLHGVVDSIGTEDALKLYYDDIQRVKSGEHIKDIEPGSSLTNENGSEHSNLENYVGKLELLLKESPAVDVHLDLNEMGHHDNFLVLMW